MAWSDKSWLAAFFSMTMVALWADTEKQYIMTGVVFFLCSVGGMIKSWRDE